MANESRQQTAVIKFKEASSPDRVKTTTYTGYGLTRAYIADFFGLDGDDVVWYDITITDKD